MKYKSVRIPDEAWFDLNKKKNVAETILKSELKKPSAKIKFTDFMRYFSKKPTYFYNDEIVNYFFKKKKRRKYSTTLT